MDRANWINVPEVGSLQEALDRLPESGGTVYVPAGSYEISAPVEKELREGQHLHLVGEGRASVLVNTNKERGGLLHLCGVVGSWWPNLNITLSGLSIIGNHESGDGLVVDYPNNLMVDACFFTGHGGTALDLKPQGTNLVVRDCWFQDCRRGVRCENIHHLTFHGNQLRHGENGGQFQEEHLYLNWSCREVRVVNNHFAYGDSVALLLDGTAQHVIANNTIEGFPVGISVRGVAAERPRDHCRDIIVSNNYLHTTCGVRMQGECRGFVIQGNDFINNEKGAIVITEAEGSGCHSITGNMIRKSVYDRFGFIAEANEQQGGIALGDSRQCLVTGNRLEKVSPGPAITAGPGGGGHLIAGNLIASSAGVPIAVTDAESCVVAGNA